MNLLPLSVSGRPLLTPVILLLVALMGSGNHTYGQELRHEGPGTFLTRASAMRLAYSKPFAGEIEGSHENPQGKIEELAATFDGDVLTLSGRLSTAYPVHGVAAYNDPEHPRGDYDAVGFTADVDDQGRFELKISELRPGACELRLFGCLTTGGTARWAYQYQVNEKGEPTLNAFARPSP